MGDRANICVRDNKDDSGVFLYTHWRGYELPSLLQQALLKKWRWSDSQYLSRIIFDVMTDGQHGKETGFGITSRAWDGSYRILIVDVDGQYVSRNDQRWSFEEYISLSEDELRTVWND